MSPLGPLLAQVAARVAKNPQLQQQLKTAAAEVGKKSAQVIHQAKQQAAKMNIPIPGAAKKGAAAAGAQSSGAKAAHTNYGSTTSSSSNSSTSSATGSSSSSTSSANSTAWGPQQQAKAFAGRMQDKAKTAFSQFNLARDFMLVIMVLQMIQAAWHMMTNKPQVNPHLKSIDKKKERERKEKEEAEKKKAQLNAAPKTLADLPSQKKQQLASGAAAGIGAGATYGALTQTSFDNDFNASSDMTGSEKDTAVDPITLATRITQVDDSRQIQPHTRKGPAVDHRAPGANITDDYQLSETKTVFNDGKDHHAYDPLNRANSMLSGFAWGGDSDTAGVSIHDDKGGSHVSQKAYDPLRRGSFFG